MDKKISPWNELDYYKEGQPIYGRDEDIRKISNSICQNLQTTLYGQSGIGKSSLLFAGIFPILRNVDYFPVFIRLGLASEEEPYVDFIFKAIAEEAQRVDPVVGKDFVALNTLLQSTDNQSSLSDSERLWQFFCYTEFLSKNGEPFIPVLVFDQFEEILNNKDTYQKAKQFLLDIYTLLDDTRIQPEDGVPYSNYRIVFSLREDYLYCLEDIIDIHNLTELRFNRFRVKALSHAQAKEVILKTADGGIEKDQEQEICEKIIEESQNYMGEVNTLMLSLVCSTCYLNSPDGILRLEALNNNEDYLYYYYENKLEVVGAKTKQYLEDVLVTNDGRRDSIDIKTTTDSGKILQEEIDLLVSNRIVRVLSSSEGGKRMEFIHDKITSIINTRKQTYWQCLKNAFKNMFNLNSRANAKEFRSVSILFISSLVSMCVLSYLGMFLDILYLVVFFYLVILSFYVYIATTIRRSHDRNVSGWDGLFDVQKNLIKPSAQQMYSKGSSFVMAARTTHPCNTMSRKEYVAAHKFLLFYIFWLFLLEAPLIVFFFDETFSYNMYGCLGGLIVFCMNMVLLRLPAMGHSPWLGLIPVAPWLYCFQKTENEQIYELNYGKAVKCGFMVCGVLIFLSLSSIFAFIIYANSVKEEDVGTYSADYYREAWQNANNGDYISAHININKAIEMSPNEEFFYEAKGVFYLRQDSIERALEMWNKVIEKDSCYLESSPYNSELPFGLKKHGLID